MAVVARRPSKPSPAFRRQISLGRSLVSLAAMCAFLTWETAASADGFRNSRSRRRDAPAAVPPMPARKPFDWSGLHLGGHVALDQGVAQTSLSLRAPSATSAPLRSVFGGFELGYDRQIFDRLLVGVQADISFPYFADDGVAFSAQIAQRSLLQKIDDLSTARARIGLAFNRVLLFATGGVAWSQTRTTSTSSIDGTTTTSLAWPMGWTVGGGAELAFAPEWSLQGEYLFARMSDGWGPFASGTASFGSSIHSVRLGLNWHFGGFSDSDVASARPAGGGWGLQRSDWNIHWQSTFVEQGYFHFRSPYAGSNSLSADTQFANTVSATAFLGLRLWDGAELYVNPEIDQGYGLSQTLGIAAFPNGEAQKANYAMPRFDIDRLLVRQTFGLGGSQEVVDDGINQLPGVRDVSRFAITAGRLSVGDAFGLNSYAFDPRTQFLNWNIYGSGSFDWTMDKPGFTWGVVAELQQRTWAFRFGYFLEPTESDGNSFDTNMPTHGQYLAEPELRYSLFSQPGALRILAWATHANMGSYVDAVAMPVATRGYPDITTTRQLRSTYGLVANVEQEISPDLGMFARASWTPGLVEVMGWTDCDESVSAGASLSGFAWNRANDRVGLAGVVEGLSAEARAYFSAGGMGILIGDGRLTYRPEEALEAYYSLHISSGVSLTLDFQLVANPAYNADRGPVPIYAARLHAER